MKRKIYLPELLSINITNYTLYPHGLDYTFDFVKGINLVLGGNGMGKTTFVNLIRFGLIGLYKKALDLTRTYLGRPIIKRQLYPSDYFSSRKDDSIPVQGEARVKLIFRIKNKLFSVVRSLDSGCLLSVSIDDKLLEGDILPEERYERIAQNQREGNLLYSYEKELKNISNLTFDDLIFFVNEILFFGEDHKTVLWNGNEAFDGKIDVQNELFNKYFNESELDEKRQDALRQARYYDSLARHKSEDMRVISSLMKKMNSVETNVAKDPDSPPSALDIINLKSQLNTIISQLDSIQKQRTSLMSEGNVLQGEINRNSIQASQLDDEKKRIEKEMSTAIWEKLHPLYDVFVKNIELNHLCPICNQEDENLVKRIEDNASSCFVCGKEINLSSNEELTSRYKTILTQHKDIYQGIVSKQRKIKEIENELDRLDNEFKKADMQRRSIKQQIRESEYQRAMSSSPDKYHTLEEEYNKLSIEKEEFQNKSSKYDTVAKQLTQDIENEILNNVGKFSSIFSSYAENFLGVKCSLEYNSYDNAPKRLYPVIDGKVRRQEESLSESQRFFIDHSFRMSILTFFYRTPAFYIVETPDSSLDISYEKNAADVFARFLENPNSVILTSNLNNSSFVSHLVENKTIKLSLIGLPDIAKSSSIQGGNEQLLTLYKKIKNEL